MRHDLLHYRNLSSFGLVLNPSELDDHYIICSPDGLPLCDRPFYRNEIISDGWLAFFNVVLRERRFDDCTISKNKTENKGGNNAKEENS